MSYFKKYVSMIRKYHNHKLQTNPQHREGDLQTLTVTRHPKDNYTKVALMVVSFTYVFASVVLFFNVTEFTVSFLRYFASRVSILNITELAVSFQSFLLCLCHLS